MFLIFDCVFGYTASEKYSQRFTFSTLCYSFIPKWIKFYTQYPHNDKVKIV